MQDATLPAIEYIHNDIRKGMLNARYISGLKSLKAKVGQALAWPFLSSKRASMEYTLLPVTY
jgi:hypothetical protein